MLGRAVAVAPGNEGVCPELVPLPLAEFRGPVRGVVADGDLPPCWKEATGQKSARGYVTGHPLNNVEIVSLQRCWFFTENASLGV